MSIYEGLEDALTKATRFFFDSFRVEYRAGNQDAAKERFKKNLQHLVESHDAAVDILEEVMKVDYDAPEDMP